MISIVIVAICFGLSFFALYFLQKKQIKNLTDKLHRLNDEKRTEYLTTILPSKNNYDLIIEINRFIEEKNFADQQYRIKELDLQRTISNISHDMRTPLTAILGYIRLLENPNLSESERQRYLTIVLERTRLLNRLILDFFDLSRLEEGEYKLELMPVDVNKVCRELLAQTYEDFEAAGINVDSELLSSAPTVIVDENAMVRVINNVLQNALRYGKEKLNVASRIENQSLVLSFSNESTSLTPQELAKIFERSYAVSPSRDNGSTGLGLSICKALLVSMGHTISADYSAGMFTIHMYLKLESEDK
ncbi:sensor histidine kinase [Bacillus massiliigorillae]|uniref:sensor histidine kinase n=1 Tax=Bacillus massiliigorillae TaxID=1243664 RepID=UPI00039AC522|nr:HAMP domain-containing sensor histidine kinase [Bacillus massiliigorillae]